MRRVAVLILTQPPEPPQNGKASGHIGRLERLQNYMVGIATDLTERDTDTGIVGSDVE